MKITLKWLIQFSIHHIYSYYRTELKPSETTTNSDIVLYYKLFTAHYSLSILTYLHIYINEGLNFPREKHQSILVVAMSAVFSFSVLHARGWPDALFEAITADNGRLPPLFAAEPTRLHTENRTRGALNFLKFKTPLQQSLKF